MRRFLVLAPVTLAATLAACTAQVAVPGHPADGDTRVLTVQRSTGTYTGGLVLPARTRTLRLHLACAGSGHLTVRLDVAHETVACRADSTADPVPTVLGLPARFERHQAVTVTSPPDSTWSVTVDASTGPIP